MNGFSTEGVVYSPDYHLENNYKESEYKTKQAKENIRLVGANQLPQASFTPEIIQSLKGGEKRFGELVIPQYSQTNILLPIEASYEIDIWGQNYLNKKSAKKQKEIAGGLSRAKKTARADRKKSHL